MPSLTSNLSCLFCTLGPVLHVSGAVSGGNAREWFGFVFGVGSHAREWFVLHLMDGCEVREYLELHLMDGCQARELPE